jgi:hypothetical protein
MDGETITDLDKLLYFQNICIELIKDKNFAGLRLKSIEAKYDVPSEVVNLSDLNLNK